MFLRHVPVVKLRFVEHPPREEGWRAIHRAAESGVRDAELAFRYAIRALDRATPAEGIRIALARGSGDLAAFEIRWPVFERALEAKLLPVLATVASRGARATVMDLGNQLRRPLKITKADPPTGQITAAFDLVNPAVTAELARHGADLVTMITNETRLAVQQIILAAQAQGMDVREQASRIASVLRQGIGLNAPQARALANYEAALVESGRSASDIAGLIADRRDRMIGQRARLIARQETLTASNIGQADIWRQAIDHGLIETNQQAQWLTQGGQACEICEPMDRQIRPLGEAFVSPFNGMSAEYPPLHVGCLCARVLYFPE